MLETFNLDDTVTLVTGGAGLIGHALCEALAEHGAHVVIGETAVDAAKELSREIDGSAEPLELDITDESSVTAGIDEIRGRHGRIDVLVNSAYPRNENYGQPYEEMSLADWQENLDLNLTGYFRTSYHVSRQMMADGGGGSIVNLGSTYGVQAPDFTVYDGTDMTSPVEYSAIKGGVINLTRYLASYLGDYGIRANTLSPGGVFDNQHPTFVEAYKSRNPLGRMAKPADFKGPVVFLASDASQYVTGHNLMVDGGWTIC